jgi:hypothetical protein
MDVLLSTLYLFFYTTPILAILSVLVAYEFLRRSSRVSSHTPIVAYSPVVQKQKDVLMQKLNPPVVTTLEEQVVAQMAPIGKSDPSTFIDTSYKPVADKVLEGASLV